MADRQAPLMSTGSYGPAIHVGQSEGPGARAKRFAPGDCYSLWWMDDVAATLTVAGEQHRLPAPAAVFLTPRQDAVLRIAAGGSWARLSFDVVHVPLVPGAGRGTRVHARPAPQPSPARVWGLTPASVVGAHLLETTRAVLQFCCREWWRGELGRLRADARLGEWLAAFITDHDGGGSVVGEGSEDWFARVRDRLDSRLGVAELAALSGSDRRRFSERFTVATGMTPRAFLLRARLDKACHLLRSTAWPIAHVAEHCGYSSTQAFATRFRRAHGLTPTRFRELHRLG